MKEVNYAYAQAGGCDAVVVPGGGLTEDGQPAPWVINRLERAAQISAELGNVAIFALSAGTTHKPPVLRDGDPIFESVASARYLVERLGVNPDRISTEASSYDTIGNAYFARCALTDPRPHMRRLVVVTSEFHMPRTQRIFEWIFGLPPLDKPYTLVFKSVPDIGMNPEELEVRRQKEAASCAGVDILSRQITSMEELTTWLYTQHTAYSTRGLLEPKPVVDPALLKSY